MTDAGFLDRSRTIGRKRIARAVNETQAARTAGRSYNHTYVSRWFNGVTPRDEATRDAIRDALSARLGRTVAPDELGFRSTAGVSPDIGLRYPTGPEDGVTTTAQLLDADLSGFIQLTSAGANFAAWNDASLSWLVGSRQSLDRPDDTRRIGSSDVDRLRAVRRTFDHLDGTFGGAHARAALVQYLRTDLPRLLRADARSAVRDSLWSAAGELTQLAAWMSYDAGLHGLAQRYFIQALGLADAGRDGLLAASILDAMSHQANFLGRYREAANMARAAQLGTGSRADPVLTAHFHLMEARALARTGDATACDRAMDATIEHFGRRSLGEGPEWISYFDESELAAELGHCHRDLDRPVHAIEQASRALDSASGDYARSRFFVTMVLADAHLDHGDVEEGCRIAEEAIVDGESVDSVRCDSYVTEFRERLTPHATSGPARELAERVRASRIWSPAGAVTVSTRPSHAGSHRSGAP
ncbi:regulatory protein [Pseudonocardia sp. Ae168_Ps1]|nr:regulatory protein [Pseudonocardia sp. Ae150A_Ps1]OLL82242.1 regulatory protein [Pseudonocardia sp. Ae168_Ps1]OLL83642.1 regulatory protein [Pseudonocardia sp. Ae263_Ps1]OLL90318.1 regulatory protein [Pseudonocardia sp. Ae356_Ps1]